MDQSGHKLLEAERMLTELETVQERLDEMQEGVRQSHRLATLGTMATIIAHEFNNILTPMISYCQLAQRHPDDIPLQQKALQKSLDGANKAAQISSSMLGFARQSDRACECNVKSVVEDTLNCLARDPKKDGITLLLELPNDLSVAIAPVSLQQILLNLILNARQVLKQKGGQLQITAQRVDDNENIVIAVKDTGPGIDPDILPDLFKPFTTKRQEGEPKGTGLGLAICHDLVIKAGGAITVESKPNAGATFRITLPAGE